MAMKNVLIADDEKMFLLSLSEGLSAYAGEFNILTAENGQKAVEVLKSVNVDLVVTDLRMPVMDGFDLLAYMSKNYPDISVIVMTAFGAPDVDDRLKSLGITQHIDKPLDYKELAAKILEELEAGSRGYIHGITLPAFLQLVEMEKKSCTLKIKSGDKIGYLYLMKGELLDARTETSTGEEAAFEVICWEKPEIEIDSVSRTKEKTMNSPLNRILMEAFRLKDESERMKGQEVLTAEVAEETSMGIEAGEDLKSTEGTHVKEEEMADFKGILNEIAQVPGVDAVSLVGRDGFLIESIAKTGIDTEMVGAIASSGFGASESMGRQLEKGILTLCMIEFERGPVMFAPVGGESFLVVVAEKESNLGMIRLKIKKHSPELAVAAATAI
jgi:predicted regulator of Ras-like GTPase activity (Roadblock/LC7/MglB family)/CheY-like chemotaxis protein